MSGVIWRVTDAETYETLKENEAVLDELDKKINVMDRIKDRMLDLTPTEIGMVQALSPEGYEVYLNARAGLMNANMHTARTARFSAALLAFHAEEYAKKYTEKTGQPYTAMDYFRDKYALNVGGESLGGFNQTSAARRLKDDMRTWAKLVDDFFKKKMPRHNNFVMSSPLVFELVNAPMLPITIDSSIVEKIHKVHHFTAKDLKKIPEKIADPLFVLRAIKDGVEDKQKRIVVTDMEINGATVMIPFILNVAGEVNKIESAYGREKEIGKGDNKKNYPNDRWYMDRLNNENLLYINKERTSRWLLARTGTTGRHNAPLTTTSLNLLSSIPDEMDLGNLKHENRGFYQFAGENAVTADKLKLSEARKMEAVNYPVVIAKKHFYEILHVKETKHTHGHKGEMEQTIINDLPKLLANPIGIMRNRDKKGNIIPGEVIAILEAQDKDGNMIVAPVSLKKENGRYRLKTFFGKNAGEKFEKILFNTDNTLYAINKKRFSDALNQLSKKRALGIKIAYGDTLFSNIPSGKDLVNLRNQNPGFYQFAGENAATADKLKLSEARKMEAEGTSAEDIYKATGWLKGKDGKWRFEIPDNLDKIDFSVLEKEPAGQALGTIYDNPALYEAYPWLENIPVIASSLLPENTAARAVTGKTESGEIVDEYIQVNSKLLKNSGLKNSLIHEIQHMIQDREGFAVGGSPKTVKEQILKEIRRIVRTPEMTSDEAAKWMALQYKFENVDTADVEAWFKAIQDINDFEKTLPRNRVEKISSLYFIHKELSKVINSFSEERLYRNLGGEQEARYTASRAELHTQIAKARSELVAAQVAFENVQKSLSKKERAQLDEYLEARKNARDTQEKQAWEKETELEEKLPENVREALNKLDDAEFFFPSAEDIEELPQPHDGDALIVFGGYGLPAAFSESFNQSTYLYKYQNVAEFRKAVEGEPKENKSGLSYKFSGSKGGIYEINGGNLIHIDIGEHPLKDEELDEIFGAVDDANNIEYAQIDSVKGTHGGDVVLQVVKTKYGRACVVTEYTRNGRVYITSAGLEGEGVNVDEWINKRKKRSQVLGISSMKQDSFSRGQTSFKNIIKEYLGIVNEYYRQAQGQQNKGQTTTLRDGRHLISLFQSADESTYVHELAHLFLLDLEELAAFDEESKKMLETVQFWAEYTPGQVKSYEASPWAKEFRERAQKIEAAIMAGDKLAEQRLKREWAHERFACGFELYLRDGKAPTKGLKLVFRQFKNFLRKIYTMLIGDGVRPSDEVKQVMMRLIASDEEIEAAALDERWKPIEELGGEKLLDESEAETYARYQREMFIVMYTVLLCIKYTE